MQIVANSLVMQNGKIGNIPTGVQFSLSGASGSTPISFDSVSLLAMCSCFALLLLHCHRNIGATDGCNPMADTWYCLYGHSCACHGRDSEQSFNLLLRSRWRYLLLIMQAPGSGPPAAALPPGPSGIPATPPAAPGSPPPASGPSPPASGCCTDVQPPVSDGSITCAEQVA